MVENVTGAGGNLALAQVAKAAPDGYTLLMGGNAALVINPNLYDGSATTRSRTSPIAPGVHRAEHPGGPARRAGEDLPNWWRWPRRSRASCPMAPPASAPRSISPARCSSRWPASTSSTCRIAAPAVLPDLLGGRAHHDIRQHLDVLPMVREGKLRALRRDLAQAHADHAGAADHGGVRACRASRRSPGSA